MDVSFFNERLSLTADYYVKKTKDMLVNIPAPAHTGIQDYPFQNVGTMQNKGVELELTYADTKGGFSYKISGNISVVRNKVTNLGGVESIPSAPLRNQGYVSS